MDIYPLAGHVLVRPKKEDKVGEFVLPQGDKENYMIGTVLRCGDNTRKMRCPVAVNDVVAFKKYSGDILPLHNDELQLVSFENLIAVIKE